MNKVEILSRLKKIFKNILSIDDSDININTTKSNVANWDSLSHLQIIMAVESEFKISIDMNYVAEIDSIKDIIDVINKSSC